MAAPRGNQNARKAKDWELALRAELHFYEDKSRGIAKGDALKIIARTVISKALDGDQPAITEIRNTLDGKPAQSIEHNVGDEVKATLTIERSGTPTA